MFLSKFFYVSSLSLLGLFGAVSCDNMSAEPEAVPRSVTIAAEGGVATTKLKRIDGGKLKSKWSFKYVHFDLYGDVRDSTVRVDTLTDGRVKYWSSWYAFYVNMAKNEIHVVVSPNKSKNERTVRFLGDDLYGAGLVGFAVYQDADSTATN